MLEDSINNIITALYSDPVYLIIGVILAALILYSLVKKLVKLMLYLSAILIIYLGYLYFTGQELPKDFNEIKEKIEEGIEQGTEIIEEQIDKVVKDKKGK
jgi:predicted tellurium resistance membrane protein TerC